MNRGNLQAVVIQFPSTKLLHAYVNNIQSTKIPACRLAGKHQIPIKLYSIGICLPAGFNVFGRRGICFLKFQELKINNLRKCYLRVRRLSVNGHTIEMQ
jgi:hypothetical protein